MIRAGTGLSTGNDPVGCAREAAGLAMSRLGGKADAALIFVSGDPTQQYAAMLEAIRGITGTDRLAGCTGAGVLTEMGEIEGENGVALCVIASDTLDIRTFVVSDLKGHGRDAGHAIGRLIKGRGPLDATLTLLFPDMMRCDPAALFDALHATTGPAAIAGGGAAATAGEGESFQFCGREVRTNSVSGLILHGRMRCAVDVTQSCRPIGRSWRVTASTGNAIGTLEGIPAVRALMENLAGSVDGRGTDLHRLAPYLFVAFPSGAEGDLASGYYVRNILGVDPENGSIFVGKQIREGETIGFALRDPDGARDDLKAMLERNGPDPSTPRLGLYFNCAARGRGLYGIPDIDTSYIGNALRGMPLVGFFGLAEFASAGGRAMMHNYSGAMALIAEPIVPC